MRTIPLSLVLAMIAQGALAAPSSPQPGSPPSSAAPGSFLAAPPAPADTPSTRVSVAVRDTVLPNGLRVLVHENRRAPLVSCRLVYATGSVHEHAGNTGIAHMLEHMLFKGTRKTGITDSTVDARFLPLIDSLYAASSRVLGRGDTAAARLLRARLDSVNAEYRKYFVKDELWHAYQRHGGTGLNAMTTDIGTIYYLTLPRNAVELFFWLEADRMTNAVMRDFYPERDVVREERRMRNENRPSGRYWESLEGMFWEAHPYGNPTIGWPTDIENYTRKMAEDHYQRYYGPTNAILVLAGDISADTAFALAARYFGPIRKGADFPEVVTHDPPPAGQKRLEAVREAAEPALDILFQTPDVHDDDIPALEIVGGILAGASGRLHPLLVDSLRLATDAGAENQVRLYNGMFWVGATPAPGVDPARIEAEIWKQIAEMREREVSPRELQRVKNQVVAGQLRSLRDMETLATQLGFYAVWGDWRLINTLPEKILAVTAADVRRVASTYLLEERSTVGTLLPRGHFQASDAAPDAPTPPPGGTPASGKTPAKAEVRRAAPKAQTQAPGAGAAQGASRSGKAAQR